MREGGGKPVKLSRVERWILANQFRILERLVPDEAEGFLAARRAVESGFEVVYETLAKHIAEPGLTSEECRDVIDTLSMFEALAKADADTVPGVDAGQVQFAGYDGTTEPAQLGFARHFSSTVGRLFKVLHRGDDFDSHAPGGLARYRRQLDVWHSCADPDQLTPEDVIKIAGAAIPPEGKID
jgi:uncharacterized protein